MARLVKTETEMEGRYQEVWVLVDEEDGAGPGPDRRVDGTEG